MNRYSVAILGIVLIIVAGNKFNADSNITFLCMVAFGLIAFASDKKKN